MNHCLHCGTETTNPKYCSRSCAAKETNKLRSNESRERQRTSASKTMLSKSKSKPNATSYVCKKQMIRVTFNDMVGGPFTKVYLCTCKHSGVQFYSATRKYILPNLARSRSEYAYSCKFVFGVSLFPLWFTTADVLIKTYGWYSTPGSRKGTLNTNGISRDHMYSVADGWKNNIPPEIISHPANCELVPHKQNQLKGKLSKITIQELYLRIDQFEKLYGSTLR